MEVIHDLAAFPRHGRGGVLSVGKFDGVHAGHAEILRRLVVRATDAKTTSTVFTFNPAPAEILRPHLAPPPICLTDEKIARIAPFHPDYLVIFPTTREFLQRSAEEFFQKTVLDAFGATAMVEGESFNFGSNRGGDSGVLRDLCQKSGVELEIVPSVKALGRAVSSSRIRSLLREGEVATARGMLGRPYRMTGYVVQGEHRGRKLGYPTANVGGVRTIFPKSGLYAARAILEGGEYLAAVNLGGNPTFGVSAIKIEAHLLDFSGDLYGKPISLDFLTRLRDIIPFGSKEELIAQMKKDLDTVRSTR